MIMSYDLDIYIWKKIFLILIGRKGKKVFLNLKAKGLHWKHLLKLSGAIKKIQDLEYWILGVEMGI